MTAPHTPVLKPGQPLTAETVGLVKRGDLLQHADGEIAQYVRTEGVWIYVDLPEAFPRDEASRWVWLGRPEADGWIEHDGGENPALGVRVEYLMRGHLNEGTYGPDASDECTWPWTHEDHDITHWRPHVPPQSEGRDGMDAYTSDEAVAEIIARSEVIPTEEAQRLMAIGKAYIEGSRAVPLSEGAGEREGADHIAYLEETFRLMLGDKKLRGPIYSRVVTAGWRLKELKAALRSSTPSPRVDGDLPAELRGIARECMETMDEAQADVLIRAATALEGRQSTRAEAEPVAIVPAHCTGASLSFEPGVLHVSKDGSGYIAIDKTDFTLEDDRCEGPDGPEGSVHWITRMAASEVVALRDFLNGAAHPAADADKLRTAVLKAIRDNTPGKRDATLAAHVTAKNIEKAVIEALAALNEGAKS